MDVELEGVRKQLRVPAAPTADLLQILPLASGTVRPHQLPKHLLLGDLNNCFSEKQGTHCCEAVSSLGALGRKPGQKAAGNLRCPNERCPRGRGCLTLQLADKQAFSRPSGG